MSQNNYGYGVPQGGYGYQAPAPTNNAYSGYPPMVSMPAQAPPVYSTQQYQASSMPTPSMQGFAGMPPPRPMLQTQQQQYQGLHQPSLSPQMQQQYYQNYQQPYVQQQRQYQPPHPDPSRHFNQTMGASQSLQNYQLDGTSQERPRSGSNSQYLQNYTGDGISLQQQQMSQTPQQVLPQPVLRSNADIPKPQSSPQRPPPSQLPQQHQQQPMNNGVHRPQSSYNTQSQQSPMRTSKPKVVIEIETPRQRQQFYAPASKASSSRISHDLPEHAVTPRKKPSASGQPVPQPQPSSTPRKPSTSSQSVYPRPLPAVQRTSSDTGQAAKTNVAPTNSQSLSVAPRNPATPAETAQPSRPDLAAGNRELPVDYQVLLLALADEYISKAHALTATVVRSHAETDLEQYHLLIATGLGCVESVLKNWTFPDPRIEARLQLRYATLLFEETENENEAQELLTKGVALCERHRLVDLKYSMLHLQARFQFRSRPRAALKMIDQLVPAMEAYKQTAWVYAFRFLRVSLCLQTPRQPDTAAALQQLRSISALAESLRHYPILAISAAVEALIHLRSDGVEAVELSQRAIAAARKHQLDPGLATLPQLTALVDCLDACCDLVRLSPEQALKKMRAMHQAVDNATADKGLWRADGTFCVPLGELANSDVATDSNGVFERTSEGQRGLVFSWIRRSELYAIGYIISGATTTHKNGMDHKAEMYLVEGSRITEEGYNPGNEKRVQSLNDAYSYRDSRAYHHYLMRIQLVFAKCNRSDWDGAWDVLRPLASDIDTSPGDVTEPLQRTILYLTGLIKQATGDLEAALTIFNSPALLISGTSTPGSISDDLRVLSALNTILIWAHDSAQHQSELQTLLKIIEPICLNHPNNAYHAAYYIVRTASQHNLPIIKMKQFLSLASSTAKKVANSHLVCMTMNLMSATFFTGIVGEQAEKSANVGVALANRIRSPLWQAVSGNMKGKTLETGGFTEEGARQREAAAAIMKTWPSGLRKAFGDEDVEMAD